MLNGDFLRYFAGAVSPRQWAGRHAALQFADFNRWSTVGSFLVVGAQLVFFYIVFQTVRGGRKAEAKSWEGAEGLEWTVPSPAPYHTFGTPPRVP